MVVYFDEDNQKFGSEEGPKQTNTFVQLPPIELFSDQEQEYGPNEDDRPFMLLSSAFNLISSYRMLMANGGPLRGQAAREEARTKDGNDVGIQDDMLSLIQDILELGNRLGYTQADYQRAYDRNWETNNNLGKYDRPDSDNDDPNDYDSDSSDEEESQQ